jgi:hypothetical protein
MLSLSLLGLSTRLPIRTKRALGATLLAHADTEAEREAEEANEDHYDEKPRTLELVQVDLYRSGTVHAALPAFGMSESGTISTSSSQRSML